MRAILPLFATAIVAALASVAVPASGQDKSAAQKGSTARADRLICRATEETGSLVRRRRQCFTRAQWDRIAEVARLRGMDLTGGAFSEESSN